VVRRIQDTGEENREGVLAIRVGSKVQTESAMDNDDRPSGEGKCRRYWGHGGKRPRGGGGFVAGARRKRKPAAAITKEERLRGMELTVKKRLRVRQDRKTVKKFEKGEPSLDAFL